MNLYEAIFVRKSVRSYTGEALSPQLLDKVKAHYRELTGLFGGIETEISVLDNRRGQQRMLSLFSVKAPYYLVFYSEEAPRYLMNMGYLMEQMVLYMCSLGIGTCFIGSNKIKKELQEKDGRKMVGIVAFGKSRLRPSGCPSTSFAFLKKCRGSGCGSFWSLRVLLRLP